MGAGVGTCIMEEEVISGQLRSKNQIPRISQNKWCSWTILVIWQVSHYVVLYLYRQLRTPSLWSSCHCGIDYSSARCDNFRIHLRLHTHKRAILGSAHAHLGGCSCLFDWVHFLGSAVAISRARNSCVATSSRHIQPLSIINRPQSDQISNSGLPCPDCAIARPSNVDPSNLFRFHMGTCGILIPPAHSSCRLHLAEPSRDERTVRPNPSP